MGMKIFLIIHPFQNGKENVPFYQLFVESDIEQQKTKAIRNLPKKIRSSSHFSAISYQMCVHFSLIF